MKIKVELGAALVCAALAVGAPLPDPQDAAPSLEPSDIPTPTPTPVPPPSPATSASGGHSEHMKPEQTAFAAPSSSTSTKKGKKKTSTEQPEATSTDDAEATATVTETEMEQPDSGAVQTTVVVVADGAIPTSASQANLPAKVSFPSAVQWWVDQALGVVEWAPALNQTCLIRLNNADENLLGSPYELANRVPPGWVSMAFAVGSPARPGTGYILSFHDVENDSILAASEPFEIKKEGNPIIAPAGYPIQSSVRNDDNAAQSNAATRRRRLLALTTMWAATAGFGVLGGAMALL